MLHLPRCIFIPLACLVAPFGLFGAPTVSTLVPAAGSSVSSLTQISVTFSESVTGVDASDEMLAIARDRVSQAHAEVRLLTGDAHALAFPDRSFDIAICLRVLMHTPRWRVCVDELCRVARARL